MFTRFTSATSKKIFSAISALALVFSLSAPLMGTASATTLTPTAQVSFTFDDGLTSARTLAADALKASGVTGTNYIITGCVGKTVSSNPACAAAAANYMTWPQITELQNTYGWEIGSHTDTHPLLATTDPDDQPVALTETQVIAELQNSLTKLKAQGFNATDFATPYGDYQPNGHPVLADIAKTYASHRGFADETATNNVFPYNDYLLYDQRILSTTTVAAAETLINNAIAGKQWIILTFHEIVASGAATTEDEYDYNVADLAAIAAYAKTKITAGQLRNVNPKDALVTNAGNLLANGGFDTAISAIPTDKTQWSTDDAANIKQNTANNGSYNGTSTGPSNSLAFASGTTVNTHIYSPAVPVAVKPYVIKSFVNLTKADVTKGEVAFYVEEYNAVGALVGAPQYKKTWSVFGSANPLVREHTFEYTPTAGTVTARIQIVIPANSLEAGFIDNVQMFAEDGSTVVAGTVTPVTPVTPAPVTPTTPTKNGDVNGDNKVTAADLSILLSNYNKAATRAKGDLNGDGKVTAVDLSILLSNYGK